MRSARQQLHGGSALALQCFDIIGESGGSFAILGSRMSTATTASGTLAASEFRIAIVAARHDAHGVEVLQGAAPASLTAAAAGPRRRPQ